MSWLQRTLQAGVQTLADDDPELSQLVSAEAKRQFDHLVMVASCSVADASILACLATPFVNVTAEGYPGRRYHAGCEHVDEIERLAIARAKAAFSAQYANVQAHSATTANQVVFSSLLKAGDRVLGMELRNGGHLTHGSKASFSGQYFQARGYGCDESGRIDYAGVQRAAHEFKPKLIICGATAYSQQVDFARFRAIADEVGALLLADVSHIAGLIVAGLHPSPIDHAHVTTTCTHKQLFGPRGGLILIGKDADRIGPDGKQTLREHFDRAIFPFFQGAPVVNAIAAKARALRLVQSEGFRRVAAGIVNNARALAAALSERGYRIVSGGTTNHTVILDLRDRDALTGLIAERALEDCGIVVNKNAVPGDPRSTLVTSGVRLGTNTLAYRGLGVVEMKSCADLLHRVLRHVRPLDEQRYELDPTFRDSIRAEVTALLARFPIPTYPGAEAA
jgi:glycine hydroxymethyltransferase